MMRSKSLLICALLLTFNVLGEEPATLFHSHRESILSGEVNVVEDYCFGVGQAIPRADTPNAKHIAKGRSALLAQSNLLANIKFSSITFPDGFTPQECKLLLTSMRKNLSVSATLEGLQTVYQKWNGTQWTSVVALPTVATSHIAPATFEDLRNHCYAVKHTLPPALLEKLGIPLPPPPSSDVIEKVSSDEQEIVENVATEPQAPSVKTEPVPLKKEEDPVHRVQHNDDGSIETFNEALYF